jgi:serine/threonine-protein phosphatase CPPED1
MDRNKLFSNTMPRRRFVQVAASALVLPFLQRCSSQGTSQRHSERRFRFIFSNDAHYRGDQKDGVIMSKVINEWKTEIPQWEFAVVAGDLTNYGNITKMKALKEHLDKLDRPYYPLVGNHDITALSEAGKNNYYTLFGENRGNYLVMHKNVGMIFLDLSNDTKPWVAVEISSKLWLRKTLAFIPKETPLMVFSHYPLHPQTPRFAVSNSIELFRLLDDHNVLAYFSGHLHSRWSSFRNNIPFFTNVRLLPNWVAIDKYPGSGYMIVDVYQSTVSVSYRETNFGPSTTRFNEGEYGFD